MVLMIAALGLAACGDDDGPGARAAGSGELAGALDPAFGAGQVIALARSFSLT